jgi:transposase InsO family protein
VPAPRKYPDELRERAIRFACDLVEGPEKLSVNAACRRVGEQLGIARRFIKPGRPWTNCEAERFNRTLQTEWAYATAWTSNEERTAALDGWLEHYNTARSHSALGGRPPISRIAA